MDGQYALFQFNDQLYDLILIHGEASSEGMVTTFLSQSMRHVHQETVIFLTYNRVSLPVMPIISETTPTYVSGDEVPVVETVPDVFITPALSAWEKTIENGVIQELGRDEAGCMGIYFVWGIMKSVRVDNNPEVTSDSVPIIMDGVGTVENIDISLAQEDNPTPTIASAPVEETPAPEGGSPGPTPENP
jgi:hypothetical protein